MTPSQLRLLETINQTNFPPIPLTAEQVTLEDIEPGGSVAEGWNTRATLRARSEGSFQRSATVFYTRLPLSVLGDELSYLAANIFTPQQLLDAVNSSRNTDLSLEELEAFGIPELPTPGDYRTVTLTARADSYGWLGSVDVYLSVPVGDVIPQISVTDAILQTAINPPTRRGQFTVLLDAPSNLTVTVAYMTVPGTAAAGVDYSTATGTLVFTPGQTLKNIQVSVRTSDDPEQEEFYLQLSNPTNARIDVDRGTCTLPAAI